MDYRVLGFISSDPHLVGTYIGGVPVLGTLDETWHVAASHRAQEILVTSGSIIGRQLRGLVDQGADTDVTVKVLPSYEQIIDGKVDLTPRKVCIEDLLRRDPVQLDQQELHHWIDGRTLLVTGSAGSIGSEICRQLLRFKPRRLICVDRWECGQFFLEKELAQLPAAAEIEMAIADVSDQTRMDALLGDHRPDIIFHAAAYKHVPLMEAHPGEAVKNIVLVTQRLADLAMKHDVGSFVMISTDKAVNPTNVMGACKRVAELYVQSLTDESDTRFVTVRFGNVLDSAGSVIPIFRQQIASGGPVTVTHPEMTRYFMTIPEASQLVIQAGAMGHGGEIFVLDMGSPVKIVDLARDMIHLVGTEGGSGHGNQLRWLPARRKVVRGTARRGRTPHRHRSSQNHGRRVKARQSARVAAIGAAAAKPRRWSPRLYTRGACGNQFRNSNTRTTRYHQRAKRRKRTPPQIPAASSSSSGRRAPPRSQRSTRTDSLGY